jgi:hypothetical protein
MNKARARTRQRETLKLRCGVHTFTFDSARRSLEVKPLFGQPLRFEGDSIQALRVIERHTRSAFMYDVCAQVEGHSPLRVFKDLSFAEATQWAAQLSRLTGAPRHSDCAHILTASGPHARYQDRFAAIPWPSPGPCAPLVEVHPAPPGAVALCIRAGSLGGQHERKTLLTGVISAFLIVGLLINVLPILDGAEGPFMNILLAICALILFFIVIALFVPAIGLAPFYFLKNAKNSARANQDMTITVDRQQLTASWGQDAQRWTLDQALDVLVEPKNVDDIVLFGRREDRAELMLLTAEGDLYPLAKHLSLAAAREAQRLIAGAIRLATDAPPDPRSPARHLPPPARAKRPTHT